VKIGLNTDSLGELSLDAMLDVAAELSLDAVEFPTGAWSGAPHVDLGRLLESEDARRELRARVADRALELVGRGLRIAGRSAMIARHCARTCRRRLRRRLER
jgi:sugar phosphate isomerase/epimerase